MDAPEAAQALDVTSFYAGGSALLPEMILGAGAAVLLVWDAFRRQSGGRAPGYFALAVLAASLLATLGVGSEPTTLFSGMVVIDPYLQFFRVLFLVAGALGIILAFGSAEVGARHTGEYHSMFLALLLGMMLMAGASDLVMLYVGVELVSLMSYVLAGFRRHDRRSAEAALKYVIYGGAASGVMLFGLSLLYGLTGETQLSLINEVVSSLAREAARESLSSPSGAAMPVALTAGVVLAFAGFAYKIAAVPLHMWSPDVYEGAPTPFTAFLSTGPKAAGFAALIRFFVVGFSDPTAASNNLLRDVSTLPWPMLIIVVSTITMVLGNLAAIGQSNVKRFLAYSSIAHAGYSLVGLAAFSTTGTASVLIYMAFYLAMNIGAFAAVIWVRERVGSELIQDYRGLGQRAPLVAICLTVFLFSLTGLPPLAGFIGKYYLFASVLDRAAHIPEIAHCAAAMRSSLPLWERGLCMFAGSGAFYAVALVGVLNSAVSLYYYARIVRNMFLIPAEDPTPLPADRSTRLILVPLAAFLVVFGIYWAPLEASAMKAIQFQRPTMAEVKKGSTPPLALERRADDAAGTAEAAAPEGSAQAEVTEKDASDALEPRRLPEAR